MNDEIGLAILEELRKQNEMLHRQNKMIHLQAKILNDIYGKSSGTLALLRLLSVLLLNVHKDIVPDLDFGFDEEDSENETLTDK